MVQAEAGRELNAKIPAPSQQLIQKCAIRATICFKQFYAHADVCSGPTTAMPNKNESTWNKLMLVIVRRHYSNFQNCIAETVSYSVPAAFRVRCQKTNVYFGWRASGPAHDEFQL
jgi:hypothetical protein